MFDLDHLLQLGAFNQLIPIWQVFFFIASMLPFLLWNRVKVCLLITYMFTYYLGFMIQWGDYLSSTGSMQPFVLYAFSGVLTRGIFCRDNLQRWSRQTETRLGAFSQSRRAPRIIAPRPGRRRRQRYPSRQ